MEPGIIVSKHDRSSAVFLKVIVLGREGWYQVKKAFKQSMSGIVRQKGIGNLVLPRDGAGNGTQSFQGLTSEPSSRRTVVQSALLGLSFNGYFLAISSLMSMPRPG